MIVNPATVSSREAISRFVSRWFNSLFMIRLSSERALYLGSQPHMISRCEADVNKLATYDYTIVIRRRECALILQKMADAVLEAGES